MLWPFYMVFFLNFFLAFIICNYKVLVFIMHSVWTMKPIRLFTAHLFFAHVLCKMWISGSLVNANNPLPHSLFHHMSVFVLFVSWALNGSINPVRCGGQEALLTSFTGRVPCVPNSEPKIDLPSSGYFLGQTSNTALAAILKIIAI